MLWSQIIYGHRTASISHKKSYDSTAPVRRPYGARPAAGRIVRFFVLFDIIRCPVKFSYYFKFHGARTAFRRAIGVTLTSAGHRVHTSDGHRTILGWNSNRTISTAAGHRTMCKKSKELSKNLYTNRPMPVRAPADVLWVELPPVRSDVYLQKYILNLYWYFKKQKT